MSTRTYIEERLKDKSLTLGARQALERALKAQTPIIHGFRVGTKVNYSGTTYTVVSYDDLIASGHDWGTLGNRTGLMRRVPVSHNDTGAMRCFRPDMIRPE